MKQIGKVVKVFLLIIFYCIKYVIEERASIREQMMEIVGEMLKDTNSIVLGPALVAFYCIGFFAFIFM
jgi:inner membrane protein involved in colicin E2 resistance